MSGHSKWAQIKRQKGAADAKRGQLFSKLANLLTAAAKTGGSDPDTNPRLRLVIEQARAANIPRENIDRAIKRGTGEVAGTAIEEIQFEVYGPGGVGILVEVTTDNRNRATAAVKAVLNRLGEKLASSGAVAYQFTLQGILTVPLANQPLAADELELTVIEAGATNYSQAGDVLLVTTNPKTWAETKQILESKGIRVSETKLSWEPNQTVAITDPATAGQILRLMENLEDLDDVTAVTANFDIPTDLIESLT